MKFKLIAGTHIGEKGEVYRAGSDNAIVESEDNLIEKWVNKFEVVGDPEQLAQVKARDMSIPGVASMTEGTGGIIANVSKSGVDRAKDVLAAAKRAATMATGNDPGAQASREASKEEMKAVKNAVKTQLEDIQRELEELEKAESEGALEGEDVTDDFPEATDADLTVLKAPDGRYNVTRADNRAKALNEGPLTKKGLGTFLKEQGTEEEAPRRLRVAKGTRAKAKARR